MPITEASLSKEERDLLECTFKPKINNSCRFVSDRTLRRLAQLNRRPPPPPSSEPGTPRPSARPRAGPALQAGNYRRATGFVRGPPESAHMPLFYFDPLNPPNFTLGQYGTGSDASAGDGDEAAAAEGEGEEEEDEEGESETDSDTDDEKDSPAVSAANKKPANSASSAAAPAPAAVGSGLAAPPLPPYLSSAGAGAAAATASSSAAALPAPAARPKIVIVKKEKKEEKEEPQVSGWQALMAEMQKRASKGLKEAPKAEKEPPKAKPEPKKAPKKKKGEFKDMMDELAYKFAVLRGEVQPEEDDEDEGDAPPVAPVKQETAVTPPPPPSRSPSESTEAKKQQTTEEKKPEEKKDPPSSPKPRKTLPGADKLKAMLAAKNGGGDESASKKLVKPDLSKMLAKVSKSESSKSEDTATITAAVAESSLTSEDTKANARAALSKLFKLPSAAPGPSEEKKSSAPSEGVPTISSETRENAKAALAKLFKPPAGPPAAAAAKPKDESAPSISSENKANAAAALSKLFSKQQQSAAPAKEEKPVIALSVPRPAPVSALVSVPVSLSKGGEPGPDVAVRRPKRVPLAPPLPSSWPPSPFVSAAPYGPPPMPEDDDKDDEKPQNTLTKGSPSSGEKKEKKKKEKKKKKTAKKKKEKKAKTSSAPSSSAVKTLQEGYYIASPQPEVVAGLCVLPAGLVSQEMLSRLKQQFALLTESHPGERDYDDRDNDSESLFSHGSAVKTGTVSSERERERERKRERETLLQSITDKVTVNDLPVPASYVATIERLKKAHSLRQEAKEREKVLELRNYDDFPVTPAAQRARSRTPTGLSRSASNNNNNNGSANNSNGVNVAFSTDKRFAEKVYTFRKSDGAAGDRERFEGTERDCNRLFQNYDGAQRALHQVDRCNAQWMNSLRQHEAPPPVLSASPTRVAFNATLSSPVSSPQHAHTQRTLLQAAAHTPNHTMQSSLLLEQQPTLAQSNSIKRTTTADVQSLHRTARTAQFFSTRTKPKPPPLITPELSKKREDAKAMKKSIEEQQLEEMKKIEKLRKERWRLAAQVKAQKQGAYEPHNRLRSHQKLLQKYAGQVEVVGGFDLAQTAERALEEYRLGRTRFLQQEQFQQQQQQYVVEEEPHYEEDPETHDYYVDLHAQNDNVWDAPPRIEYNHNPHYPAHYSHALPHHEAYYPPVSHHEYNHQAAYPQHAAPHYGHPPHIHSQQYPLPQYESNQDDMWSPFDDGNESVGGLSGYRSQTHSRNGTQAVSAHPRQGLGNFQQDKRMQLDELSLYEYD